jgi:hypothetical protein
MAVDKDRVVMLLECRLEDGDDMIVRVTVALMENDERRAVPEGCGCSSSGRLLLGMLARVRTIVQRFFREMQFGDR